MCTQHHLFHTNRAFVRMCAYRILHRVNAPKNMAIRVKIAHNCIHRTPPVSLKSRMCVWRVSLLICDLQKTCDCFKGRKNCRKHEKKPQFFSGPRNVMGDLSELHHLCEMGGVRTFFYKSCFFFLIFVGGFNDAHTPQTNSLLTNSYSWW